MNTPEPPSINFDEWRAALESAGLSSKPTGEGWVDAQILMKEMGVKKTRFRQILNEMEEANPPRVQRHSGFDIRNGRKVHFVWLRLLKPISPQPQPTKG